MLYKSHYFKLNSWLFFFFSFLVEHRIPLHPHHVYLQTIPRMPPQEETQKNEEEKKNREHAPWWVAVASKAWRQMSLFQLFIALFSGTRTCGIKPAGGKMVTELGPDNL